MTQQAQKCREHEAVYAGTATARIPAQLQRVITEIRITQNSKKKRNQKHRETGFSKDT